METGHDEISNEKMMWRMKRHEHRAIRVLTAVIVTIFVFWCGFEFGEIRATVGFGHDYGGEHMMQRGWSTSPIEPNGTMPSTLNTPRPTSVPVQATGAVTQ